MLSNSSLGGRRIAARLTTAAVFVAIGAATGCGSEALESEKAPSPFRNLSAPTSAVTASITGGNPEERELLRTVLAGLGATSSVVAAEIGDPPAHAAQSDDRELPATPLPENARWLYVTLSAASSDRANLVLPFWEGSLAAGAFRTRGHSRNFGPLVGATFDVKLPDGSVLQEAFGANFRTVEGFDARVASRNAGTIAASVRGNAKRAGVTVESIEIRAPAELAPRVVVRTDTSANVHQGARLSEDLLGDLSSYEGTLVEVRDSNGALAQSFAYLSRAETGIGWIRPDLRQPEDFSTTTPG